jgi:GT2 family glycosyltransferase
MFAGRVKQTVFRAKHRLYINWINKIEPTTHDPIVDDQSITVSIVVPCYNTPKRYINDLVQSVIQQTYQNWQLCIADGSNDEACSRAIREACAQDSRIIYIRVKGKQGISGNTNSAIKHATGSLIAFVDHDDVLAANALNEVVSTAKKHPEAAIIYSDEDRLSENGRRRQTPLLKPDWSLDFFLSANYVTHLLVIKSSLLKKLGGLREAYDGSQDYDLVLRALDYKPEIVHIPKVLYHMRQAKTSTASTISAKSYVHSSGNRALKDYFQRNQIRAKVLSIRNRPTNHRIKYELVGKPLVSIIIPFKDKVGLLKTSVTSILTKTTYPNYEIILISNNSKEKKTFEYLKTLKSNPKIKQFTYDKPFNYSEVNNFGRRQAQGKVLVFLNNDTKVISPEWLEELASVATQKRVGAVGAMLLYPDKTIQHAGVVIGLTGMAGHIFRDLKPGTLTALWLPDWPRNYIAVTGACLAVAAEKFDKVGGFDESFIVCGSDVALGIALHSRGLQNVYWPYAKLIHYESKSVGSYDKIPPGDYERSLVVYKPYLDGKDPYFNSNLNMMSEIPTLRTVHDEK